eukprot:gb/GECG01009793.1/.p1 GENE.gb/GECG01009793.1/~~gb/GECG01009793.1/.p1  ORF type:complete len:106 (+),score=7.44 gb/GECG01009793.1/:1-318(+)
MQLHKFPKLQPGEERSFNGTKKKSATQTFFVPFVFPSEEANPLGSVALTFNFKNKKPNGNRLSFLHAAVSYKYIIVLGNLADEPRVYTDDLSNRTHPQSSSNGTK